MLKLKAFLMVSTLEQYRHGKDGGSWLFMWFKSIDFVLNLLLQSSQLNELFVWTWYLCILHFLEVSKIRPQTSHWNDSWSAFGLFTLLKVLGEKLDSEYFYQLDPDFVAMNEHLDESQPEYLHPNFRQESFYRRRPSKLFSIYW